MKALGTGVRGVAWKDIEVIRAPSGAPSIRLHGRAKARAERLGVLEISLSMSHSREYAVAFVVTQCAPSPISHSTKPPDSGQAAPLSGGEAVPAVTALPANLKVVTAAQMTALEQESERQGVSTDTLMENAGLAVAEYARRRLGRVAGTRAVILVGPGNNGADGLVAARHLRRWGAEVTACLLTRRPDVDPKLAAAREYGVTILDLFHDGDMGRYQSLLSRSDLVIDAVLGTGRSRPLEGLVREALVCVSALEEGNRVPLMLALDLPTGLDADTGAVDDATPVMDATLALGYPKAGLLAFPGAERVGELAVLDIGLPGGVGQDELTLELLTPEWVGSRLPPRPRDSHKGTYGHLLVVAGSRNYVGAACLAARAAHRSGAGLVTLATPQSVYPLAASHLTETIHLPLPEDGEGRVHPDAADVIREICPGSMPWPWAAGLVSRRMSAGSWRVCC